MFIVKNGIGIQEGDLVRYKTLDRYSCFGGEVPGKVLTGKVKEIFDSMNKTYKCLWIEGQTELILESQVLEKVPNQSDEQEDGQMNSMCVSCRRLNAECAGTAESVWTGCVYRSPDNCMEITVIRPQASNYTPADLMISWSRDNGAQFFRTPLGSARIRYKDRAWQYNHWKMVKNEDGTETITLYLETETRKQK